MGTLKPSQTLTSKFEVSDPTDHSNLVLPPPLVFMFELATNMAPASVRQTEPIGLSSKVEGSPPGPPFHQYQRSPLVAPKVTQTPSQLLQEPALIGLPPVVELVVELADAEAEG